MPVALGYQEDISGIIGAADVLAGKCGTGFAMMAMATGVPLIVTHLGAPNERGNMRYVVENGYGWYCPRPRLFAERVSLIIRDRAACKDKGRAAGGRRGRQWRGRRWPRPSWTHSHEARVSTSANDRASGVVLRFVLIAVVLGFGVNAFLSLFMDRAQFIASLRKVLLIYFAVPLLLFIASHVVDSLRLMLVVSQFRIRLTFVQAFYNSAVGTFFTNITPMTAGGQPFQIYHLSVVGVPPETSTNVIMSRFVEQAMTSLLISLFFLTQISWIAASPGHGVRLMYVALGVSLLMTMFLLLLLIRPHFIGRVAIVLERTALGRLVGG